ncbi:Bud-site selection protein [Xylariaceae sp. FL0662B]|nr:Bud-site selection protein [Xylariaceae sp. FL0662B]
MPKRKREPSLEEKLAQWKKELVRGMKTAKGFERQRLSKRIREADADKVARLEREVAVLKSLDLHQAAHAHLCSALLRIRGVAESPRLPADIRPVPKPELADDERAALHNVTSALFNRKQVRDVIDEAVVGTCVALRVPMPERKGKGKGKNGGDRAEKEEQADDRDGERERERTRGFEEPALLKRNLEKTAEDGDLESEKEEEASDGLGFEGFLDSDAEERAFSRYDDLVGGSSDEDESDEGSGDGDDFADSKAKSFRKPALDDMSITSTESEEEEEEEGEKSEESEGVTPPPKKAKTKTAKTTPISNGSSAFLPTLMGGYISGSESASDIDDVPARKNRRGQRARQAIWEKKYKDKAKHLHKEKTGRDQGWDMRRGAVGDDEAGSKPWKKGIRNPFDKQQQQQHVHPERQQRVQAGNDRRLDWRDQGGDRGFQDSSKPTKPVPKRDDAGPLHPSWAAAKKAKEGGQKIAFQGRKVVFD